MEYSFRPINTRKIHPQHSSSHLICKRVDDSAFVLARTLVYRSVLHPPMRQQKRQADKSIRLRKIFMKLVPHR
ncbi:hypothetical protein M2192_004425 [Bradyrhizobium elkanii USDA 61]|nr:hypothetical protein [Bradyrhizobium elkanii]MCS4007465.1 hypothetical protein [Bradyrhizobium elkanii USDA 61]MCS3580178.1 hypothetical protein [Bradyrhizobium elkanii]MCS4067093.1 hypothetical protein [Bradyrhizobium elkanii]MCW2127752.1 hypothetical protein [Bradyrhizobium elkanii]